MEKHTRTAVRASPRAAPTSPHVTGREDQGSEQLVVAVARHDPSALEELLERYAGQVHAVVRSVLRGVAQSEDVAREVFLEIWSTASCFDAERASARTWILATAHRRAVERLRSLRTDRDRQESPRRGGRRQLAHATDEHATAEHARAKGLQIRDALAKLPAQQREAVELAYYEGFTRGEIAERLGTPLATVTAHLRDGLVRLRDALRIPT